MEWMELGKRLGVPEDALEAAAKIEISAELESTLREAFDKGWQEFDPVAEQLPDADLTVLQLYLKWAAQVKPEYERRGIPESVYFGTLKDIAIWCRFNKEVNGKLGLYSWPWCARGIRIDLFRLGRLEFEMRLLPRDIDIGDEHYSAGTEVISVHIPAEDPLRREELEESFALAEAFFKEQFGKTFPLFYTHTWLLGPELQTLLPENAGILQFQSCFEIFDSNPSRQAEERVYGNMLDDPAGYPEDTSLRRALKGYLMAGKTTTEGYGIRRIK